MKATISQNHCLICPNCKGENLHQRSAKVYFRECEDSEFGKFIKCSNQKVESIASDGNPSVRRDGLLVSFDCESCDAEPELAIFQHKGVTYIEWHSMRMVVEGSI